MERTYPLHYDILGNEQTSVMVIVDKSGAVDFVSMEDTLRGSIQGDGDVTCHLSCRGFNGKQIPIFGTKKGSIYLLDKTSMGIKNSSNKKRLEEGIKKCKMFVAPLYLFARSLRIRLLSDELCYHPLNSCLPDIDVTKKGKILIWYFYTAIGYQKLLMENHGYNWQNITEAFLFLQKILCL
jgi:hypothetical protein